MSNPSKTIKIIIPVALLLAGGLYYRSRPASVSVISPEETEIVESIAASGRVRGDVESDVCAISSGRLQKLFVKEGDTVTQGQPLAAQENAVNSAEVAQAVMALATAQEQVALASRRPIHSDVERLRVESQQAIRVASAKLAAAEQRLLELKAGPTREEIEQAEAALQQTQAQELALKSQVVQAQAQTSQAELDVRRQTSLFEQGAISRSEVDRAETAMKVARSSQSSIQNQQAASGKGVQAASAKLRQLRVGTRTEVIAQAKSEVEAARATVAGARETGPAQIRSLLSTPRIEDIRVAQARMAEAEQTVRLARQRLADTVIRSPFKGVISRILLHEGSVTGPAQALLRLIYSQKLEIRADIDEANIARLREGQEVVVSSDAYPGSTLRAKVQRLGAQVDSDKGSIEIVLLPLEHPKWLRPGMTLSTNIITSKGKRQLTVPLTAIKTINNRSVVFVIRDDRAIEQVVTTLPAGTDRIPILSGLKKDDMVVVDASAVEAGKRISPRMTPIGGK